MGFAAPNPSYVVGRWFVGWVEQRETHHFGALFATMGFAALNPSYELKYTPAEAALRL